MRLIVIRHGVAEEQAASDAERALTKAGRRKMARVAAGLRHVVGAIDVLGASPLVRARQTAEIVRDAFDISGVSTVEALSPGKPLKSVLQWVQRHDADAAVALVGHEPQLGLLVSWLLCGDQRRSFVRMRKGGACLLSFDRAVRAGAATLEWALKPKQLRQLR